jgi:hypothetical protein
VAFPWPKPKVKRERSILPRERSKTGAPTSGSHNFEEEICISIPTQICPPTDCAIHGGTGTPTLLSAPTKFEDLSLIKISFSVRSAFFQIAPCHMSRPSQLSHHESHTHLGKAQCASPPVDQTASRSEFLLLFHVSNIETETPLSFKMH